MRVASDSRTDVRQHRDRARDGRRRPRHRVRVRHAGDDEPGAPSSSLKAHGAELILTPGPFGERNLSTALFSHLQVE